MNQLLSSLQHSLFVRGFDIATAFCVRTYVYRYPRMQLFHSSCSLIKEVLLPFLRSVNCELGSQYSLPCFGRDAAQDSRTSSLGVLVGNTKHLWPLFIRHLIQVHDFAPSGVSQESIYANEFHSL